jgi:hypothetical protein
LGLVQGYAYPTRLLGTTWGKGVTDKPTIDALTRIQLEIEAARNGLVYVVRSEEIRPLIDEVAISTARARGNEAAKIAVPRI